MLLHVVEINLFINTGLSYIELGGGRRKKKEMFI